MALFDIDAKGHKHKVKDLAFREEFDKTWAKFTKREKKALIDWIDGKIDTLIASPPTQWGSILNTSIEGGLINPHNGAQGDWSGTVYDAIYHRCGQDTYRAALFFGNLWKWRFIEHPAQWIGIRHDPVYRPTFPNREITLQGKTYFLDRSC